MKKLIILLFALFAINSANTQGCLPEGITFTTQEQIDNFQTNYPECTEIEGDVLIYGSDINNLNGLNVLTSIGGVLIISSNSALTSLSGLEGLTSVGGYLEISFNAALNSLTGLEGLTSVGGYILISYNDALTSLTGLDNLTSIDYLIISVNTALTTLTGLEGLTSINWLYIDHNPALTSMTGLDNVTSIGGYIHIYYNDGLTSLTGLEGLTSIGNLLITYNFALTSLTGLEGLTSIGGDLEIGFNTSLTSLTGLEGITSIGDYLFIYYNPALTSLTGLDNLTSIGGTLYIGGYYYGGNDALTSLTGLDNIAAASITDLFIINNISLSNCEVQSICDYLAAPNGTINISDNASGCNSQAEVEAACEVVTVGSIDAEENYFLFPNPANQSVIITSKSGTFIEEVTIHTQTGQKVYRGIPENNMLDISKLQPGMYVVEVATKEGNVRKKLVVQ